MPIAICGVSEVPAFATIPLDHIISIREIHQPAPDIQGFKTDFTLHSFVFCDTGDPTHPLAVSEKQIGRLINIYAQTNVNQNMLFHCFAGVSRSSAAAFIWLAYHGMPYAKAYQTIVSGRGQFVCPNQLMIKLADQLMDRGGEMAAFMSAEIGRRAPEREAYFAAHR